MDIPKPELPASNPDRHLDCERALEPAFSMLAVSAVEQGWTEEEVTSAFIGLAASQALRQVSQLGTKAEIDVARNMIRAIKSLQSRRVAVSEDATDGGEEGLLSVPAHH